MDFKPFPKIERFGNVKMQITQKIHGTNAQVYISEFTRHPGRYEEGNSAEPEYQIRAGSRTRWIFPEDDNYGFAAWVEKNKAELIAKLGPGQHFGEWAGPGINSGEGLSKKTFVLFDYYRYDPENLPPDTTLVPLLYEGAFKQETINAVLEELKTNGSKLVSGFMRPEGVVIQFGGKRYKRVFDAEETQWTKPAKSNKGLNKKEIADYTHLCQPIRLEKLLSRDERYIKEYPTSLGSIVKDYVQDLVDEQQIIGAEDQIKAIRKGCTGQIFKFIKEIVDEEVANVRAHI